MTNALSSSPDDAVRSVGHRQLGRPHRIRRARKGLVSLKLILLLPVFLTMLGLILEVGNLWLARLELENSLESAALSAVKEWGDADGALGTFDARQVGNQFAFGNSVRGMPVSLAAIDPNLNYSAGSAPNQNLTCPQGVLIFGALTSLDPDVVFDASAQPDCNIDGDVMIDATGHEDVRNNRSWGIAFRATNDAFLNANMRIDRVVIDVDPAGSGLSRFNFNIAPPSLSDNLPRPWVRDMSGNTQPDNFGFDQAPSQPTSQVTFTPTSGFSSTLTIDFNGTATDAGFSPGDRIRFGANVEREKLSPGNFVEIGGDEIGQLRTIVTVYFSVGGVPQPAPFVASFFDNATPVLDSRNSCFNPGIPVTDALGNPHLIVHGRQITDLPCPPKPEHFNNGQAYAVLDVFGTGRPFAVHVQAEKSVPTVMQQLFGFPIGPFSVCAEATAYYDCSRRRPCLIRLDQFLCN